MGLYGIKIGRRVTLSHVTSTQMPSTKLWLPEKEALSQLSPYPAHPHKHYFLRDIWLLGAGVLPHWGPRPQAWPLSVSSGRNLNYLSWTQLGTGTTAGYLSLLCLSSTTGACWWPGEQGGSWEGVDKAAHCTGLGFQSTPVPAVYTKPILAQPSFWIFCLPMAPLSALLTLNALSLSRLPV